MPGPLIREKKTDLFHFSQQLPRLNLGPLKGSLTRISAFQGPSTLLLELLLELQRNQDTARFCIILCVLAPLCSQRLLFVVFLQVFRVSVQCFDTCLFYSTNGCCDLHMEIVY